MKKLFIIFSMLAIIFITNDIIYAEGFNLSKQSNLVDTSQNIQTHNLTEDEVRYMMRKNGITEETIDNLIEKWKKGELWDSLKQEYQNLQPQINTGDYKKTVYPDGSVSIEQVIDRTTESPYRSIITTRNVEIIKTAFVINAYFYMDYSRDTVNNTAKIISQSDPQIFGWGITFTDKKSGYWNDWRNPTNAWVSFRVAPNVNGDPFGGYGDICWLKGFANGSGHWTEYNF